jgi:hypothetical protein
LRNQKARPSRPGFFCGGLAELVVVRERGTPIALTISQFARGNSASAGADVQILGKWHNPNVDVVDLVLSNPARLTSLVGIAEPGIGHAVVASDQ